MSRDMPQASEASQLSRGWIQSVFQHKKLAAILFFMPLLAIYLLYTQTKQQLDICNFTSSHKCVFEDGHAETRICHFQDILLHKGKILYLYQGAAPELPDIMTNWHHNLYLEVLLLDVADISDNILNAQLERVTTATLTHRQWHLNYYHSVAESVFELYNLACMTFQLCNLHTKEDFVPIFVDKPGVAGWDTRLGESGGNWEAVLSPAAEALQCFYPKPAIWVADPELQSTVFWLQAAVAGIGPYNRKWPGPPETAARFQAFYKDVDTQLTVQYRRGLIKCLDIKPAMFTRDGPFKVTIVNREYHAGRHMVNINEVSHHISTLPEVSSCRVAQLEGLTFKQQATVFAESQVIIMTHGAALGNVLFMSPGSIAIFYNWLKIAGDPHSWVTDMIKAYALPVNFVGLSTEDRRFIYPQKEADALQRYIFQSEYEALPSEEKRALLEEGLCPGSAVLQDCNDLKMNFAIDWNLLRPALDIAFHNVQSNHSEVLDGTGTQ